MLVGVVGCLGSEAVLSPVVSHCLRLSPSCGGWVLVGVVGFLGSEVVLSPVVSRRLRLSPSCVGSGCWLVWSASWALKWSCPPLSAHCLRLSPFVCGSGCWLVWSASWALKWSCLPLSPVVSLYVGVGVGWCGSLPGLSSRLVFRCLWLSPFMWDWVLVGVVAFLGSQVVLFPVVSGCLSSCGEWVLVGVVGVLGSEVVLSPVVSHCLWLSPFVCGSGCWLVWSETTKDIGRQDNLRAHPT